jgi:transposase-like protein
VKGRQRPLSADAARLYTALTRNTLERRALTAQRDTLIREVLNAGYRYADIADALGCTASTAWRIANGAPTSETGER